MRAYSILPAFSWLVDEWLNQVSELPGELIETDRFAMVAEAFVKKRIAKASCTPLISRKSQVSTYVGLAYPCV